MSLSSRAGELVMIGFPGTELDRSFATQIKEDGIGGVILFTRNVVDGAQLRSMTEALQALVPAELPLLISIDQEGGIVSRIAPAAGTAFPGNMALGATGSAELTEAAARAVGEELRALGINFNLAPVLDVNNNPRNPVIGVRSFGEDPALVAALGNAAVRGYQRAGVLACGKHFPGHGDTAVDSHLAFSAVPHGKERLEAVELVPFKAAIEEGIAAIMTAHVGFPAYEPEEGRPATLSHAVLTGLLREELGYDGLVITDCMEMKAIADGVGTVPAAVEAIKAGADIVLISHTQETQRAAVKAIAAAIESGEIPAERAEAALNRVTKARKQVAETGRPSLDVLKCEKHETLSAQIAEAAVTVVKDEAGLLPLSPDGLGVIVCGTVPQSFAEEYLAFANDPALAQAFRAAVPGAEVLVVDRAPTAAQIEAAVGVAGRAKTVVLGTYLSLQFPAQADLVAAVQQANPRTVVVAQRSPYDLRAFEASTYVAQYEEKPMMAKAVVEALLSGRAPGKLTVTI
ncbi:MAG TPA: beta-N-acetylhexosaminidase [Symbiobacteriaceae bacterium]|nr:beta-N-acetylhexosaminidase [Symbiobacteriaceae bacterium]